MSEMCVCVCVCMMRCPQANALHQQIAEITDRRAAADRSRAGDKAFMQLRQAQQMAGVVARKRDDLAAKLDRMQVRGCHVCMCVYKSVCACYVGAQTVKG